MEADREQRIARALYDAEVGLCARGYTAAQAAAAVRTARAWAWGIARVVSPAIRDQAFEDLLGRRLRTAAVWIERSRAGVGR